MDSLAPDFRANAKNIFGMRGTHYNLWPDKGVGATFHYSNAASTGEIWPHPYWISAGGWCMRPFWDYYLVTGDLEFLRNHVVPGLKELALVHFNRDDPFSPVIVPWGPSCSTFITYPAGMAERAPTRTAFMGPQDPTQNRTLPPGMMVIGIPAGVALEMAANLENSFVVKRSRVAFPDHGNDHPS